MTHLRRTDGVMDGARHGDRNIKTTERDKGDKEKVFHDVTGPNVNGHDPK